jgi:hypothetical protein
MIFVLYDILFVSYDMISVLYMTELVNRSLSIIVVRQNFVLYATKFVFNVNTPSKTINLL